MSDKVKRIFVLGIAFLFLGIAGYIIVQNIRDVSTTNVENIGGVTSLSPFNQYFPDGAYSINSNYQFNPISPYGQGIPSDLGISGAYYIPGWTCSDGDGGINYNKKGTINLNANTPIGAAYVEDECIDSNTLTEWTCGDSDADLASSIQNYMNLGGVSGDLSQTIIKMNAHACPYGCENGMCKSPTSICGNGVCASGESCPGDSGSCTDRVCYIPTCLNGCGETLVAMGMTDGTQCAAPNYCNGAGSCVTSISQSSIQLSIATLKNSYSIGEQIKLTVALPKKGVEQTAGNYYHAEVINLADSSTPVVQQSPSTNNANINFSNGFKGYIIEFEDAPVVVEKVRIEKVSKEAPTGSPNKMSVITIQKKVEKYSKDLDVKRNQIKTKIFKKLPHKRILGETKNAFNGIALDITAQDVETIRSIPGIKRISPNYYVQPFLMDAVPLINADDVWHLDKNGNNCRTSGQQCLTGKGVTIAILDSGVDYTHPDFGGCTTQQFLTGNCAKFAGGYDFVDNDSDPMDLWGHGTHIAGIIAGNGSLIKGVAPDTRLLIYRIANIDGNTLVSNFMMGMDKAEDPNNDGDFSDRPDIISLSFGRDCGIDPDNLNYSPTCGPDDSSAVTIDNAVNLGITVVAATGNHGPNNHSIGSPAIARKAITVGNSNNSEVNIESSRGSVSWIDTQGIIQEISKPDVVAPGTRICSAKLGSGSGFLARLLEPCLDESHFRMTGSSMAAPMVAGAVALMKQKNYSMTPEEIKYALKNTAVDLGYAPYIQGSGRIDVLKAISSTLPLSKIFNGEQTTFSGTLSISVQKISNGNWQSKINVISQDISIPSNGLIKLDSIFNSQNVKMTSDGYYRVFVKVVNSNGQIVKTADWEFKVGQV